MITVWQLPDADLRACWPWLVRGPAGCVYRLANRPDAWVQNQRVPWTGPVPSEVWAFPPYVSRVIAWITRCPGAEMPSAEDYRRAKLDGLSWAVQAGQEAS